MYKRLPSLNQIILLLFIGAKFLMQYLVIDPVYELHRDEYLHLDLGRHLAFGYMSVPPVTGLISYLILLLGNSVFWVKFFPALFGAMVIYVVWKTIEELNGGLFALVLGSVSILFSVFVRINTLYQPNSLDFLLWTIFLYLVVKYLKTENVKWIYAAAVAFAVGILNKYNIGFLALAFIPSLLLTRHRNLFLNKHLWFAASVALLLMMPNLIWQIKNDFPVMTHLQTLSETQLVNVKRTDFLIEQLFFFAGSLFVILFGLLSFFINPDFKRYRILFLVFVFTLTIFTVLKAKSYYSIGLYPVYIAFGAVCIEKLLTLGWRKYIRALLIAVPVATFVPLAIIMLPVLTPREIMSRADLFYKYNLTRWEDGKIHHIPQDYADMIGWKELAAIVDSTYDAMDENEFTLVHCDNYGQAGAINYYTRKQGLQALSFNADYIGWYPLERTDIRNVILVKDIYDSDPGREKERPLFDQVQLVGEITNPYARESGAKVYLLKGARQPVNELLRLEINTRKQ